MNRLPIAKRVQILGCLTEGLSMRATTRLCDVSINTVTKLLIDVGTACDIYQNDKLRKLSCLRVTPAMAAGISDHVWSLEEIARLAD